MNLPFAISTLTAYAQRAQGLAWLVLVCPDDSVLLKTFRGTGGAPFPPGSEVTGRTVLLPGGSRFSVVPVSENVFVPDGTPFYVAFTDWGNDIITDSAKMKVWRDKATGVLT